MRIQTVKTIEESLTSYRRELKMIPLVCEMNTYVPCNPEEVGITTAFINHNKRQSR